MYGWGIQERVLAENTDNISVSIPTSHKHKFSVDISDTGQGKKRVNLPLSSIVSKYTPPVRTEFDPSVTSMFYIGSTLYCSDDFGSMLLKSSHFLEYVECSPISQAGKPIVDAVHVLPTSLNLACVVARSLCDGTDLGKVLRCLQRVAYYLMDAKVDNKLPGICDYSDLVPQKDGHYELIEFIPAGRWGSSLTAKTFREGQISIHPQRATTSDLPTQQYTNGNKSVDVIKERQMANNPGSEHMAMGVNVNLLAMGALHPLTINTSSTDTCSPSPPRDQLQPPQTPEEPLVPSRPERQDVGQDTVMLDHKDQGTSQTSTNTHGSVPTLALTPSQQAKQRRFSSLQDVPEDISSLSVQDVCDCLRLLRLDNHIQTFTNNLVDGPLLLTRTANDLESEFGFTKLRARQVERFAKEGWRPKMDS